MYNQVLKKLAIPVGLISIACSFLFKHLFNIPDFWDGFLLGFGISLIIGGLILIAKSRSRRK